MKKFYLSLICTAALVAAMGFAGCKIPEGSRQITQSDAEVMQQQADNNCPDGNCPEDYDDVTPNDDNGENPGKDENDCPDGNCPEKDRHGRDFKRHPKGRKGKRGRFVLPRGSFSHDKRKPKLPKLPVQPPEGDDIIIPDPPVDRVPQN